MSRRRKHAFSYHAVLPWMARSSPAMRRVALTSCFSRTQGAGARSSFSLSPRRQSRQLLATRDAGAARAAGERLRGRTLPAVSTGIQPGWAAPCAGASGYLPGAASLLCEVDGRRVLYAGPSARARLRQPCSRRAQAADAVCLDATFGDPRFVLPPREERSGVAAVCRGGAGAAACAVLLVPLWPGAGCGRGAADCRHCYACACTIMGVRPLWSGWASCPPLRRFAGKLGPHEHCSGRRKRAMLGAWRT